ncbi:MAG: hypothetical protein V4636_08080 [Pseudomonadota bacterium]
MLHPIFSTVLGHPELIIQHLANYAALIKVETGNATRSLLSRVVAGVVAIVSGTLALGFAGIAVMLGVLHGNFHWVLVAVPGIALLIALIAGYVAAKPSTFSAFEDLRTQLDADVQAMQFGRGHHAD